MATLAGREPAVWWGTLAISLLVLVIEITPVLIKLLSPYGPYDERRRVAEHIEMFAANAMARRRKEPSCLLTYRGESGSEVSSPQLRV
jgi:hypothetical protein